METGIYPKAITLDAAGTLIQVAHPVGKTYARFAEEFAIPVTADQLNQQFRLLFPRMPPLAFGQCNKAELQRQEQNWWQTLVRNCLGVQGRHSNFRAFFERLYNYYASVEAWHLYPDAGPELERIGALKLPVSVVSNFDSRLPGILRALGIHDYFKHIHYSSACGSAKPHSGIFRQACDGLNTRPAETLHVGDNYKADVTGAEQAGLRALFLDRAATVHDKNSIGSLHGLAARLTDRD